MGEGKRRNPNLAYQSSTTRCCSPSTSRASPSALPASICSARRALSAPAAENFSSRCLCCCPFASFPVPHAGLSLRGAASSRRMGAARADKHGLRLLRVCLCLAGAVRLGAAYSCPASTGSACHPSVVSIVTPVTAATVCCPGPVPNGLVLLQQQGIPPERRRKRCPASAGRKLPRAAAGPSGDKCPARAPGPAQLAEQAARVTGRRRGVRRGWGPSRRMDVPAAARPGGRGSPAAATGRSTAAVAAHRLSWCCCAGRPGEVRIGTWLLTHGFLHMALHTVAT